jgi:hypothetical protein
VEGRAGIQVKRHLQCTYTTWEDKAEEPVRTPRKRRNARPALRLPSTHRVNEQVVITTYQTLCLDFVIKDPHVDVDDEARWLVEHG